MTDNKKKQNSKSISDSDHTKQLYKVYGRIAPRSHFIDRLDKSNIFSYQKRDNVEEVNNKETRPTASNIVSEHDRERISNIKNTFSSAVDADSIGRMLSSARTSSGMTKVAAAAAMNKGEKAVRDIESGVHNPTLPRIQEYAAALGYDVQIHLVPIGKSEL